MNRPWSRFLRCGYLASYFASPKSSPLLSRTIRIDGRTDLHNRYPVRLAAFKPGPGCGGVYTKRRTGKTAKAVARVHTILAEGQTTYLVTHTMADDCDHTVRRYCFRMFLDRLRKHPLYKGHLWCAERHESGHLHHHVAVRMSGYWPYKECIQRWSKRYCQTVNGLDVQPPKRGRGAALYAVKAFWYLGKGIDTDKLPFRWWGTSKVQRKVFCTDDDLPPLLMSVSTKWWPHCARVDVRWSANLCAAHTAQYELRRGFKARRILAPVQRGATTRPG